MKLQKQIKGLLSEEIERVTGGNEIPPGTGFWDDWPFNGGGWISLDDPPSKVG